jgi:hypothetical protein
MSSLLMINGVYRLEIQSVMLVLLTPLVNCCPSTLSLTHSVRLWRGAGVLTCVVNHILQEFNTLFLNSDQIQNLLNCYYTTPNKNDQLRRHLGIGVFKVPSCLYLTLYHKVRIYKEYHSVCLLVGIGNLPTLLSPASVPLPPEPGGGGGRAQTPKG